MTGSADRPLRQPDQRSCGAACLVRARMLGEPAYDRSLRGSPTAWSREVLAVHRRVTGWRGADGRWQVPWPRSLGTPPWAVARRLSRGSPEGPYAVRLAPGPLRRRAVDRVARAAGAGRPAALYVGSRWLPRHVVLVTGGDAETLTVYDPGPGTDRAVRVVDLRRGGVGFGRWDRLWLVVVARTLGP